MMNEEPQWSPERSLGGLMLAVAFVLLVAATWAQVDVSIAGKLAITGALAGGVGFALVAIAARR